MRSLFLHIGCGKTGSSALQVWLNHNAEALERAGVHYPLFGAKRLEEYAITSGNGVHLANAVVAGGASDFLGAVKAESEGHVLFSSEAFQDLPHRQLMELRSVCEAHGLEPVVIAYVRDVYDIIYSSYLQLVKRHLYTRTFKEFALSRRELQQFNVVRAWSGVFENMSVIHYDSEREHLDDSFCEALGVGREQVPRMTAVKVNRSLSLEEAEILRLVNEAHVKSTTSPSQRLCSAISDAMIMDDPELATPILLDDAVVDHVRQTFSAEVGWVNERFFGGRAVLSAFEPQGKFFERKVPTISRSVVTTIRVLLSSAKAFEFDSGTVARRPVGRRAPLDIEDPRIADVLRDEAIRREALSVEDALSLMGAAKTLRPDGPMICRKVDEYRAKLGMEIA